MKSIADVVASGTGRNKFINNGCFGHVFEQGPKRVEKKSRADGTGIWLERCWAIQKRLGIDHELCAFMPEVFDFKWIEGGKFYVVVMARYQPQPGELSYSPEEHIFDAMKRAVQDVLMSDGSDSDWIATGDLMWSNIMWCPKRGYIATDPSCANVNEVRKTAMHPKFSRAKRVVTQYGPPRRH